MSIIDTTLSNYEYLAKVARKIHRVYTDLADTLSEKFTPFDVTGAQYVVLSALYSGRVDTAAQICKEISYSAGAMTRMLDRLEQKQLIQRVRKSDSRREIKLELTPKGKEIYPKLQAIAHNILNSHIGVLDEIELKQFEYLLTKIDLKIVNEEKYER